MKLCQEDTNVRRHSSQISLSLAMPRPVVKSSPSDESFETHLPYFLTWKLKSIETSMIDVLPHEYTKKGLSQIGKFCIDTSQPYSVMT